MRGQGRPCEWRRCVFNSPDFPSCPIRRTSQVSEDCLYLNVFKPVNTTTNKPLPIMIFFYGGSWKEGSASFLLYNPTQLISLVRDVVIITTNYRLGAFGFLASRSLRAQDPDNSTGNYGLQDQRFALEVRPLQWELCVRVGVYTCCPPPPRALLRLS